MAGHKEQELGEEIVLLCFRMGEPCPVVKSAHVAGVVINFLLTLLRRRSRLFAFGELGGYERKPVLLKPHDPFDSAANFQKVLPDRTSSPGAKPFTSTFSSLNGPVPPQHIVTAFGDLVRQHTIYTYYIIYARGSCLLCLLYPINSVGRYRPDVCAEGDRK